MEEKKQEKKSRHEAKKGVMKKEGIFEEKFKRKFEAFGRLPHGTTISPELIQRWPRPALPEPGDIPRIIIGPLPRPTMAIAGIFYARFLPQEGKYIPITAVESSR